MLPLVHANLCYIYIYIYTIAIKNVCHFRTYIFCKQSRDSSVSIVTMLRAGGSGVVIPAEARQFSVSQNVRPTLGPSQPHCQWVQGFLPTVKRSGRDADHLLSSTAEVKNEWKYTSTPPICLHDQHTDNLRIKKADCVLFSFSRSYAIAINAFPRQQLNSQRAALPLSVDVRN
jgi:hypothetical protein